MDFNDLIFIVEDDHFYGSAISAYLESKGYSNIEIYHTGKECLRNLYKRPQLVLLDYNLQDIVGMNVLLGIIAFDANTPVVFISGQESIQMAIETLKYGAYDYIQKDNKAFDKLSDIIKRIGVSRVKVLEYKKNKVERRIVMGLLTVALLLALTFVSI